MPICIRCKDENQGERRHNNFPSFTHMLSVSSWRRPNPNHLTWFPVSCPEFMTCVPRVSVPQCLCPSLYASNGTIFHETCIWAVLRYGLLCFKTDRFCLYPSGFTHWHPSNLTIVQMTEAILNNMGKQVIWIHWQLMIWPHQTETQ